MSPAGVDIFFSTTPKKVKIAKIARIARTRARSDKQRAERVAGGEDVW